RFRWRRKTPPSSPASEHRHAIFLTGFAQAIGAEPRERPLVAEQERRGFQLQEQRRQPNVVTVGFEQTVEQTYPIGLAEPAEGVEAPDHEEWRQPGEPQRETQQKSRLPR